MQDSFKNDEKIFLGSSARCFFPASNIMIAIWSGLPYQVFSDEWALLSL
jgi:hypothetical protein